MEASFASAQASSVSNKCRNRVARTFAADHLSEASAGQKRTVIGVGSSASAALPLLQEQYFLDRSIRNNWVPVLPPLRLNFCLLNQHQNSLNAAARIVLAATHLKSIAVER